MYVELAHLDKMSTEETTRKAVFAASRLSLNGVSVLPAYLSEMKDFTDGMVLSSPVDYPHGTSHTDVRSHGVLSAIRRGANTIDLVMNHSLVVNKKINKAANDLTTCLNLCINNGATLRVMMEYRVYEDYGLFFDVIDMMADLGIEYVYPATGQRLDNFANNLLAARVISQRSKMRINVITNGSVIKESQYDTVKAANIYGIRFSSIPIVQTIFGV